VTRRGFRKTRAISRLAEKLVACLEGTYCVSHVHTIQWPTGSECRTGETNRGPCRNTTCVCVCEALCVVVFTAPRRLVVLRSFHSPKVWLVRWKCQPLYLLAHPRYAWRTHAYADPCNDPATHTLGTTVLAHTCKSLHARTHARTRTT
jgi:hypothetical protein